MFTEDQKKQLIKKLTPLLNKRREFTCPMCGESAFSIVDGYFINTIQDEFGKFKFGRNSIPTISIICTNCGFISQHALGIVDPQIMKVKTDGEK